VQYLWLTIIVVSLAPVALLSVLLNPLMFMLLGADAWRDRVARLHPLRWWIVLSLAVGAFATTVYAVNWGS
jgi:hypothetical protein